ncbi:hypothetical protein [Moraxella lacunata]|uniref:hypothetical protein n=1 Tax=Moraxella lacunata TaxID=477 RepID=UPI003EE3DD97
MRLKIRASISSCVALYSAWGWVLVCKSSHCKGVRFRWGRFRVMAFKWLNKSYFTSFC